MKILLAEQEKQKICISKVYKLNKKGCTGLKKYKVE